ncbi:hypothetical protein ELY33_15565 [Vreelandella andesensis]|uniref:Uncharacterized protein n=1 Tax=Vreelandella andesensis TaxID=447567 RepID=A0A433KFJ3_9GAMM|nr:hypothetical protein [Halomonas andesensis]RUR27317.1 hypothetical protein ELY33_15565 [Halomonas andesensis]
MSLRDVLQQRRLRAGVPAVPATFPPPGTEKGHTKQGCSRRSRCSRSDSTGTNQWAREVQAEHSPTTPAEIAAIIGGLKAVGRSLGLVEALAREAMAQLTQEAAAELAVVLDDVFEVAPDDATARAHCRRLLNDPQALANAKAVWPSLPPTLAAVTQTTTTATVVDHAPQWLRLIRQHCALVPEDERLLTRCLGMRPARDALQAAQRYVTTWQQAASAEPREAARDNSGRRAANNELRGGSRHAG